MDWEFEEEILLVSLFYKCKPLSEIEKNNLIYNLSGFLIYRAKLLDYEVDENFRNVTGIKMKLHNIDYVDSNGMNGLSKYSELDKKVVQLYKYNRYDFNEQFDQIMSKYKLNSDYIEQNEKKQRFCDWSTNIKKSHVTERNLSLLCDVDKYALESNISKISIWDISKDDFRKYITLLVSDSAFNNLNKSVHYGYTIALAVYLEHLMSNYQYMIAQKASEKVETYNTDTKIDKSRNNSDVIKQNTNSTFTKGDNEDAFFNWVINDTILSEDTAKKYIASICEVNYLALQINVIETNIFNICSSTTLNNVLNTLNENKDYILSNRTNNQAYFLALYKYLKYLTHLEKNNSTIKNNINLTEIGALFSNERFSLFSKSLISDGIFTFEQLKKYKILRYLNNRNIYPANKRKEISEEILLILEQAQNLSFASDELNSQYDLNKVLLNFTYRDRSKLYFEFLNISDSLFSKVIENKTKTEAFFWEKKYDRFCQFCLLNGFEYLSILIFIPYEMIEIRNKLTDDLTKQVIGEIRKWLDSLDSSSNTEVNGIEEIMKMLWKQ